MEAKELLPRKLAIAVCCHFDKDRLGYLDKMSNSFKELASEVFVTAVTNTSKIEELAQIESAITGKGFDYQIFRPNTLGHPLLLTWAHFPVFEGLLKDQSFTHFMYLEDDTLITRVNMAYWLESRDLLKPFGLIPSFLRVENKIDDPDWYSSDCANQYFIYGLPRVKLRQDLGFINLPQAYQGIYLLDRELMLEHLNGDSYSPNFGIWGIQEKAAQGVTFTNVPIGFTSRNLIPYYPHSCLVDERCLIHHLPNNYAQPKPGGKVVITVPVKSLLSMWPTRHFFGYKNLRIFLRILRRKYFKRK